MNIPHTNSPARYMRTIDDALYHINNKGAAPRQHPWEFPLTTKQAHTLLQHMGVDPGETCRLAPRAIRWGIPLRHIGPKHCLWSRVDIERMADALAKHGSLSNGLKMSALFDLPLTDGENLTLVRDCGLDVTIKPGRGIHVKLSESP